MNDTAPQVIPVTANVLMAVLEYLDSRPHRESRPLIDAIQFQIQQFQKANQETSGDAPQEIPVQ